MKVIIKGGIWKNTEDEILKAAVMKYGKNQWARISSLLVRKTPKQCKARWYEWLDPSIKKTDWSKEEDEKLLHLAKLMPTQWRTIAPIVGRTPAQCLERYQKLLDEAELGEGERGPTGEDVRRLRPGEIDPDPETKPARPDPIDMDEDANTQGKKAKRKARERQLEESRRLAAVKKRRELREAGIDWSFQKKIKSMDYNDGIPFYRKAPAGFYDTTEEDAREKANYEEIKSATITQMEGKRKIFAEQDARKEDAKKLKEMKESGKYIPAEVLKAAQETELKHTARRSLVLPAPQVSQSELEKIVKIGYAGETAKAIVDNEESASKALLGDYSAMPQAAARTPRVVASEDQMKMDARNLRAMAQAQTPLLGEAVETQGDLSFAKPMPANEAISTPNPLAATLTPRPAGPLAGGQTPSRDQMRINTPSIDQFRAGTPSRDQMGINTPARFDASGFGATPVNHRDAMATKPLSSLFSSLPKPKNDFEIVMPEEDDFLEDHDVSSGYKREGEYDEDAGEIQKRQERARIEAESKELNKRSQAVKLDLPRPLVVAQLTSKGESEVDRLILKEMQTLLLHDARVHPYPGQHYQSEIDASASHVEEIEEMYLEKALVMVRRELAVIKTENEPDFIEETAENIEQVNKNLVLSRGVYKHISDVSEAEHREAMMEELERNREIMKREAMRAGKMEKKLSVVLGGYQSLATKHIETIKEKQEQLLDLQVQLESYKHMQMLEEAAIPARIEKLREEVGFLARRESDLQAEYKELLDKRNQALMSKNGTNGLNH